MNDKSVVTELAVGLKELHSHNADLLGFDWHKFIEAQTKIAVENQIAAGVNPEWIEKLHAFIETNLKLLPENCPTVFLHSDVHFGNLRCKKRMKNGRFPVYSILPIRCAVFTNSIFSPSRF